MGEEVSAEEVGRERRRAHRERLQQSLQVLGRMLADHAADPGSSLFESEPPLTGMEVELVLVDDAFAPSRGNTEVLAALDDPGFQPEIGAHTIELNLPPGSVTGQGLPALEQQLRDRLNAADERARRTGARILMTGLLPTLLPEHLQEGWMTPSARYRALQDAVLAARGEDVEIDICAPDGVPGGERLSLVMPSIAAESACTSTQLHLKVAPERFADTWNAAQLLMGPQLALGANSPFGLGRRLWDETRVALFAQSVDTRTAELRAQGVRSRVFVGEGWATSVLDLFAENVRWFPALLPRVYDEDPVAALEAGRAPHLGELRLHGGTVWRWNRPVYDVVDTAAGPRAHLRVENRVLPAGPTVVDVMADAAFYYGAVRVLVEDGPHPGDPAAGADAGAAHEAFLACAASGLDAEVTWPGAGRLPARRLLLERLLPLAAEGLARWGVPADAVDRYLGVAEARAATGRTGARWQARTVAALQERGADRPTALAGMVARYAEGMHSNEPVHTWPLP